MGLEKVTPLRLAARAGAVQMCELLLFHGANKLKAAQDRAVSCGHSICFEACIVAESLSIIAVKTLMVHIFKHSKAKMYWQVKLCSKGSGPGCHSWCYAG